MDAAPSNIDPETLAALVTSVAGLEFSTFEIGVLCQDKKKKSAIRRQVIGFVSKHLGKTHISDGFDLYILIDLEKARVEATPQSVYVEGRYNKFSRKVAQTFHYCFKCKGRARGCDLCNGTGKLSEHSVQELIEKAFTPAFDAEGTKFHGCGREDVDVRMLGTGRPFVVELVQPKRRVADLYAIENSINSVNAGVIQVQGLRYCEKGRVAQLKNDAFRKIYSAKCKSSGSVTKAELSTLCGKTLEIVQRTPERVEKRRSDMERKKTAQLLKAEKTGGKDFMLEILASHGLYIKEFISGDGGRTNPSISSLLGKKCMCVELDVLEIMVQGQNGKQ